MEPTTATQPIGAPETETLTEPQLQAQSRIDTITKDTKSPYFDRTHPDHEAAVREMASLHQTRHPAPANASPDAEELNKRDVPLDSHRPDAVVLPELPDGHSWDFGTLDDLAKDVIRPLSLTQTQSQGLVDIYGALVMSREDGKPLDMALAMRLLDTRGPQLLLSEAQMQRIKAWATDRFTS